MVTSRALIATLQYFLLAGNWTQIGGDFVLLHQSAFSITIRFPCPSGELPMLWHFKHLLSANSFQSRLIGRFGWIKTRSQLNLSVVCGVGRYRKVRYCRENIQGIDDCLWKMPAWASNATLNRKNDQQVI